MPRGRLFVDITGAGGQFCSPKSDTSHSDTLTFITGCLPPRTMRAIVHQGKSLSNENKRKNINDYNFFVPNVEHFFWTDPEARGGVYIPSLTWEGISVCFRDLIR